MSPMNRFKSLSKMPNNSIFFVYLYIWLIPINKRIFVQFHIFLESRLESNIKIEICLIKKIFKKCIFICAYCRFCIFVQI